MAGESPSGLGVDIRYGVPAQGWVKLTVWSVEGEVVRTLVDSEVASGPHEITWGGRTDSGRRVEPGMYYCRIRSGEGARNIKIVLAR